MFTTQMQSVQSVLDNMALPEMICASGGEEAESEESSLCRPSGVFLEKKLSVLEIAFFFRGGDKRDVSLVRNKVLDISSSRIETALKNGVVHLPIVNKEVLKHIFREAFHERCSNYDDVELISEALAQNCIVQLQGGAGGRLRGSFKMTITREFSQQGVSDFTFALSAFQSKFQGLDALEEKCDIKMTESGSGKKHKVEIRPKKLRRPSSNHSEKSAGEEIKEVLASGGSVMIQENGFRRGIICRELLSALGFLGRFQDKMLHAFEAGIIELERAGYAFRGRGVVAYVCAGETKRESPKVYLILQPFSDGPYPDVKMLQGLQKLFVGGMEKCEPSIKVSGLLKVKTFESDSFFFDGHAGIELSRLHT